MSDGGTGGRLHRGVIVVAALGLAASVFVLIAGLASTSGGDESGVVAVSGGVEPTAVPAPAPTSTTAPAPQATATAVSEPAFASGVGAIELELEPIPIPDLDFEAGPVSPSVLFDFTVDSIERADRDRQNVQRALDSITAVIAGLEFEVTTLRDELDALAADAAAAEAEAESARAAADAAAASARAAQFEDIDGDGIADFVIFPDGSGERIEQRGWVERNSQLVTPVLTGLVSLAVGLLGLSQRKDDDAADADEAAPGRSSKSGDSGLIDVDAAEEAERQRQ